MVTLRNVAKCDLAVRDGNEIFTISPGQTVELETSTDFKDNIFVQEGWIEIVKPKAPAKATTKAKAKE